MHICFLTLDFPPFRSSGLTVYAELVVKGLAARGHKVTVVAAERAKHNQVEPARFLDNVSVVRVPIGPADWIGFGWQAARYLRAHCEDFDVVHFADVHFAYAYSGVFVASAFQSFRQRLTSCGGQPYHTNWRNYIFRLTYYNFARWFMEHPAIRRSTHIIMPSQSTQSEFVIHYNVPISRTTLVYPGIDLRRFDRLLEQEAARRKLALPIDIPILLYVSFFTPRKGAEYLAHAIAMMQTPILLLMVGKWEMHYQELFLGALGTLCSRVNIVGYVPDEDLLTYFAAADVYVSPTLLEGFGYTLVEAMAAGLPVVTTDGGAAGEIVGEAGITVPVGDSRALASALDRVLVTPRLSSEMRQCGRKRAYSMFDVCRTIVQIENIYSQVLGVTQIAH